MFASQRANAQSEGAIVGPGVTWPSTVSRACVVSTARVVSSVAGRYGTGLPMTLSGCEAAPERLTMRASTLPVTSEPSGLRAIGTATQWFCPVARLAGIAVPPALSACQPLATPMSPSARSAGTIVIAPPRLGTSCHIMPLAADRSTGRVTTNVVS